MPSDTRKFAKPPRILIVDDDAGQRSLLSSFLKGQGFDIVTADSGERALETLRTNEFSMMISDVRMPGMLGRKDTTVRQATDGRLIGSRLEDVEFARAGIY